MATTKIWPIKDSLARVVDYARNPEKTIYLDLQTVLHLSLIHISPTARRFSTRPSRRSTPICPAWVRKRSSSSGPVSYTHLYWEISLLR